MEFKLKTRRGTTTGSRFKAEVGKLPAEEPNEFYVIIYRRESEQCRGRLACARLSEHQNPPSFGLFLRRREPSRSRRHQNILEHI
jgi:hypothetical protein